MYNTETLYKLQCIPVYNESTKVQSLGAVVNKQTPDSCACSIYNVLDTLVSINERACLAFVAHWLQAKKNP